MRKKKGGSPGPAQCAGPGERTIRNNLRKGEGK